MNGYAARLAALCVLLGACLTSFACLADDERLLGALDETAEIGHLAMVQSIPTAVMSVADVKVFQAELNGLRSKFGPARIARLSRREGSPFVLCYSTDDLAIVFRAGAMGGWKRVTGFTAVRADTLGALRSDCAQSERLAAWMRQSGKELLNSQQLSRKLGMNSLPPEGILATKSWMVGGKEQVLTSVVAYSQGSSLNWVDVSQFVER